MHKSPRARRARRRVRFVPLKGLGALNWVFEVSALRGRRSFQGRAWAEHTHRRAPPEAQQADARGGQGPGLKGRLHPCRIWRRKKGTRRADTAHGTFLNCIIRLCIKPRAPFKAANAHANGKSILALASGLGLLLTLYTGLLIMLPLADFLDNARSGALTLKPSQCAFQGFIFLYMNLRHRVFPPLFRTSRTYRAQMYERGSALPCAWVASHSECLRTFMLALTNPWPRHCGTGSSHAFHYTPLAPFRQVNNFKLNAIISRFR